MYLVMQTFPPEYRILNSYKDLNHLYAQVEDISNKSSPDESQSNWLAVRQQLEQSLEELTRSNPTFSNADQARAVIGLVFDKFFPLYIEYHEDLLFHHTERTLFRPLFVGRIFEVILKVRVGPGKMLIAFAARPSPV